MPKTDAPATRRSARVAQRVDTTTKKPEPAPAPKKAAPKKAAEPVKAAEPAEDKAAAPEKKTSKKDSKTEKPAPEKKTSSKKESKSSKDSKGSNAKAPASKETAKKHEASSDVLKLGDALPKITIQDNTGADVDVSTIAGEKGVVIFLYPKANTPGCTTQACGFRDIHDEISDEGYEVYGLSKDLPAAQQKWVTAKNLNYKLLCDPESLLIKKLGAFVLPNNTKRSHFIFEKGTGKLIDIALGVKPVDDPSNALEFIKKHHA